jgi:FkbM family methyltransferase
MRYILYKLEVESFSNILDIGSWHALQSIELANLFPDAEVNAFEPVPESYSQCVKNASESGKNIKVHNLALSNTEDSEVPFYVVDAATSTSPNLGASSLLPFEEGLNGKYFNHVWNQNAIRVKSDTLDSWCAKNGKSKIDLIWIDVQGAEKLVFEGGVKTLENVKVIFTEVGLKPYYKGHNLYEEINGFLVDLGFKEVKESWELNGADCEANTIYIKKP